MTSSHYTETTRAITKSQVDYLRFHLCKAYPLSTKEYETLSDLLISKKITTQDAKCLIQDFNCLEWYFSPVEEKEEALKRIRAYLASMELVRA